MGGHFLEALRGSFAAHAARAALEYDGRTWTYAELDQAGRRCAAWLQSLGIASGDRVALFTPNKLPFLIGQLGVFFAGAAPLPLNPRFTREEVRYFLGDSGARLVLAGREQLALATELSDALSGGDDKSADSGRCAVAVDEQVLSPHETAWREPEPAANDPCLILYSSGTTGWPKGVVHTQANVASSLHALAACWRMAPDDVVVNVLPLFHIHGLAFATLATWLSGACLLVDDAFDPLRTMELIGRASVFMAVPPMYYRLLEESQFAEKARTWRGTRLFTCGSAPIRPEVLPRLEEILQRPVINRYGMTESFVITSLPLDGPWPHGSVGRLLDGVELTVTDEDGGTTKCGDVGSVRIRGPNLFARYWNKPAETEAAFAGGWFDTGDLGRLDENGFLTLVGRKHDLIIVSGYNVYPQVVERVLGDCPGMGECAVFGVVDDKRGESVAVAVVRKQVGLDEETVLAWCRERLVHYQQPRQIVFVDALPRNALGKVLRRELSQLL